MFDIPIKIYITRIFNLLWFETTVANYTKLTRRRIGYDHMWF